MKKYTKHETLNEVSAGGVVIFNNAVLMLRKFNGDWVLPKGRLEEGENLEQAAIREVFEETGCHGHIIEYIGKVNYVYKNMKVGAYVSKEVHWYLMETKSMNCRPQKSEGFIKAEYVHMDKVLNIVRYNDERNIIKNAIKLNQQRSE